MRILLIHGEGLGNIVQALPLICTLEKAGHKIDVFLTGTCFDAPVSLFGNQRVFTDDSEINVSEYDGKIVTVWANVKYKGKKLDGLRRLNIIGQMSVARSEVEVYLDSARELGIKDFTWNCKDNIACEPGESYDVVLSNGYNWRGDPIWKYKQYAHYPEVVQMLKADGLRVCSIGAEREYVEGTSNETEKGLKHTLGLIASAGIMLTNDSGFYHCAAALRVPTLVIFTFTSVKKNYDNRFHETVKVLKRDDLPCQADCHATLRVRKCQNNFACQDISAEKVYSNIRLVLK